MLVGGVEEVEDGKGHVLLAHEDQRIDQRPELLGCAVRIPPGPVEGLPRGEGTAG